MATKSARGQITIVDLNDGRTLNMFLTPNLAAKQIYNTDNKTYSPDWTGEKDMIITPEIFVSGDSNNQVGTPYVTNLKFYINGTEIGSTQDTTYGAVVDDNKLVISKNMISDFYRIEATAQYTDSNTGQVSVVKANTTLSLESTAGASIRLIVNHPDGVSFKKISNGTSVTKLRLVGTFYRGSTPDTEGNTWEWYKDGEKIVDGYAGSITGYNTNTLTVTDEDVTNIATFKCKVTDNEEGSTKGQYCEEAVTLYDATDPYSIEIDGLTTLTKTQQSTSLTANIVQNSRIDTSNAIYSKTKFKWLMYDSTDTLKKFWDVSNGEWVDCSSEATATSYAGSNANAYSNVEVKYTDVTIRCRIVCAVEISI